MALMLLRACFAVLLFALTLPGHRLPIKIYTTSNGMPRNSARCIVPDSNGLLWVCTSEGLVRFDGYQFRLFGTEHGLPSRSIFDFVASRSGGYWVVTDAGICRLKAGSKIGDPCRLLHVDGPIGDYQQDCLVETPDGHTWVATSSGLFRVSDDGLRLETAALDPFRNQYKVNTLAVAPDGSLLAGSDFAVFLWKPGGQPRNITARLAGFAGAAQIRSVPPGDTWIVSQGVLYRLSGWLRGDPQTIDRFVLSGAGHRIVRSHDGTFWLASMGISHVQFGPEWQVVSEEAFSVNEGLPSPNVVLLAEDRQGNVWGSTDGAGIFRVSETGFKLYTREDGLGLARIASIFEDVRGDLCVIAPEFPNLRVQDGPRFQTVAYWHPAKGFDPGWGWNQFGLQARDGEWWFPTGSGLFRFAKADRPKELQGRRPLAIYNQQSHLKGLQIFRVFEDSHRDIWISTLSPDQLIRWSHQTGEFHPFSAAEGWPAEEVPHVIREASSGTVWVGTYSHILRFRNGRFELLPALPTAQMAFVRDLYIDHVGRVWVATGRYGLYRCDNPEAASPTFRNYSTNDGMSSNSVRSITEDSAGFIYAGTVRGVDRIDPQAPPGSHHIRYFTTDDGLPASDHNVAFRDRRGHLWFGTLNGLSEFDPAKTQPLAPPEVYVTRFRVRGVDVPLPWEGARSLHVNLGPDRNQFEIEYAGIDLRSVASVRYQYRLVGVDHDWSQPVDTLSVNYASLPAGQLRFELRAVTADGQAGPSLAGFDLDVQAPVWRRWWFLALAGALLNAVVVLLHRYRVQHLLAIERLRTRIATDLHDDIGASLTQISILSELAHRGAPRGVLEDIAGLARELVQDMSDIVWAVNPRHDRFEALAHRMRRFAADTLGDIELDFDAASLPADFSVPLECRRPLYLVFKEAAHNVARHSAASRALIRIELTEAAMKLTVQDNGRGFDPKAPRDGEGLNSINRRLREIGGSARWEQAPGGGTTFTAIFPIHTPGSLPKLRGTFARIAR